LQLETSRLSGAAQLAVIVLNVPATLIVPQGGIFHFAISFLATSFQRASVDVNVLAGLGKRASGAVITIPVASVIIVIPIPIPISIVVTITAICVMVIVAAVAIISLPIAGPAGATEVPVQVLDFSIATIKVTEFSVAPVAALVLAGGREC
jgi:hypothetical protein